ncbi:MAG: quinol:cytochrome C oxidoreductase [Thermonemataceae bacterium]
MADHIQYNLEERYEFTPKLRKQLLMVIGIGLLLLVAGAVFLALDTGGGHHGGGEHHGGGHHEGGGGGEEHGYNWMTRIWANFWLNGIFFTEIAVMGVLFLAIQYLAKAGWSASFLRIPTAFGNFLPFTGGVLLIVFLFANHDLFHWTHSSLYDKAGEEYDSIIANKAPFFFWPFESGSFPVFWLARFVLYFVLWYWLYTLIKKQHLAEDNIENRLNVKHYDKATVYSAIFIVIFAVTSSTSAWDWVMSIDTHWFSTMFGWYMFASGWVSGLAVITLAVIYLKEQGYLKMVNENHLHDLGKFMFAFSIFWTYIWFSQFLLIYYANMAEETIYFYERLYGYDGIYSPMLVLNLIINFVFPFLFLMTRDAKRKAIFLKVAAWGILIGHYLDFFVMIMPGTVKENGGFFLVEIGTLLMFIGGFVLVFANTLSKYGLIPKNHPMLEESLHHSI